MSFETCNYVKIYCAEDETNSFNIEYKYNIHGENSIRFYDFNATEYCIDFESIDLLIGILNFIKMNKKVPQIE